MTSKNKINKSPRLAALSTAALALPGVSQAAAPTETTYSYRYTFYNESALSADEVANETDFENQGNLNRYDIKIVQMGLNGPLGKNYAYNLQFQDEVLSGASPWSTELASDGSVDVIMSGASIYDHRTDISGSLGYYYDKGSVTGNMALSVEDDYESVSFGLSTEREFDNKQTAWATGFSYSSDSIDPEDSAVLYNRRNPILPGESESKTTFSIFTSVSRVLTASSQVLGGISYTTKEGYLHDAYKQWDQRPAEKNQFTLNLSYRHYIKPAKTAAHVDYRYYDDDWGVTSQTLYAALYKNFNKLQVIPSFRYYLQSSAKFYFAYQPIDENRQIIEYNYFSNDARLSDFGAVSLGLRGVVNLKPIKFVVGVEYYTASQDMAPSRSEQYANPGLIEYTRVTFGMDYIF